MKLRRISAEFQKDGWLMGWKKGNWGMGEWENGNWEEGFAVRYRFTMV
jgi:hypothetical protein